MHRDFSMSSIENWNGNLLEMDMKVLKGWDAERYAELATAICDINEKSDERLECY